MAGSKILPRDVAIICPLELNILGNHNFGDFRILKLISNLGSIIVDLGAYLQLLEWLNLGTYLQLLEWLNLGTDLQLQECLNLEVVSNYWNGESLNLFQLLEWLNL